MDFQPNEFREFVELGLGLVSDFYPKIRETGYSFGRLSFDSVPDGSVLDWNRVIKKAKGSRDVAAFGLFEKGQAKAVYAFQIVFKSDAVLLSHVERFVLCPSSLVSELGIDFALNVTGTVHELLRDTTGENLTVGVKDPLVALRLHYMSYGSDAHYDPNSNVITYRGGL